MKFALLIAGIVVVLASVITLIVGIASTPKNLRGFYGKKYIVFTVIGIVAGVFMTVISFLL